MATMIHPALRSGNTSTKYSNVVYGYGGAIKFALIKKSLLSQSLKTKDITCVVISRVQRVLEEFLKQKQAFEDFSLKWLLILVHYSECLFKNNGLRSMIFCFYFL